MKKTIIKKAIIGLGLITTVIFSTSCTKKSEDPKPDSKVENKSETNNVNISKCYIFKNDSAIKDITPYLSTKWMCLNPNRINDTIKININKKYDKTLLNIDLYFLEIIIIHTGGNTSNYSAISEKRYSCYNKEEFFNDYSVSATNNFITYSLANNESLKIIKINPNKITLITNSNSILNTYELNKVII